MSEQLYDEHADLATVRASEQTMRQLRDLLVAVAAGLPLPDGAATSLKQDTGNGELALLGSTPAAKTPTLLTAVVAAGPAKAPLVAQETFARALYLNARKATGANAGNVYFGIHDSIDDGTSQQLCLAPGDTLKIEAPPGTKINLALFGIDGANAGDGVTGFYIPA